MNPYYEAAEFRDAEFHGDHSRHRYVWQLGLSLMGIGLIVALFGLLPMGTSNARRTTEAAAPGTLLFWGVNDKGTSCAYVVGANGRDMHSVWPNPAAAAARRDYKCGEALLSPDGRTVVISLYRSNAWPDKNIVDNYQLLRMNVDGSRVTPIWRGSAPIAEFAFSPDSRRIAFSLLGPAPSIVVIPAGSTSIAAGFTPGAVRIGAELAGPCQPAFSHGGDRIVFVAGASDHRSLYTAKIDGSGEHCVAADVAGALNPAFGVDDSTLVYLRHDDGKVSFDSLDLTNGARQNVQPFDPELRNELSRSSHQNRGECSNANGRGTLFAARNTEPAAVGVSDVWYAHPDGTHLRRLLCGSGPPAPLHDAYFERLSCSADGNYIACAAGDIFGDSGLCITSTSGTHDATYIPLPVAGMDVKGISYGA